MTRETSKTIFEWGRDTFGPITDDNRVIERARLEFDELAEAVREGHSVDDIVAEAADVVILLSRLAGVHGRDLAEAVDRKMNINRSRTWVRNGDGTGCHVKT
jgi:NTP pyrophosphatase (non-canonical NTP hydrolase)